jgi:hypothetical protein
MYKTYLQKRKSLNLKSLLLHAIKRAFNNTQFKVMAGN